MLTDTEVSREHARIIVGDQTFAIEDLRSANGVLVNGQPVTGLRRLNTGDTFQVGGQVFEVLSPTEGEVEDDRAELTVIARRSASTEAPPPREEGWSERPTGIVDAFLPPGRRNTR